MIVYAICNVIISYNLNSENPGLRDPLFKVVHVLLRSQSSLMFFDDGHLFTLSLNQH